MIPIYSRSELLMMKKKEVIQKLGYKNIKDYYKSTGDRGKVSRKQFIKLYLMNNK